VKTLTRTYVVGEVTPDLQGSDSVVDNRKGA